MHPPLPTETRLLGCTPGAYHRLIDEARLEAGRLHTEAVGAALAGTLRQLLRLLPHLERRPVRGELKPCRP
jgi:hypothetical protein